MYERAPKGNVAFHYVRRQKESTEFPTWGALTDDLTTRFAYDSERQDKEELVQQWEKIVLAHHIKEIQAATSANQGQTTTGLDGNSTRRPAVTTHDTRGPGKRKKSVVSGNEVHEIEVSSGLGRQGIARKNRDTSRGEPQCRRQEERQDSLLSLLLKASPQRAGDARPYRLMSRVIV